MGYILQFSWILGLSMKYDWRKISKNVLSGKLNLCEISGKVFEK